MKVINPWNIVSAGVYPLNKNVVPSEKPMPCESFRDSTHLQKMQAVRAGKQAVESSPDKNGGANPYHGVQMPKEDVSKYETIT
ncbi:hypothetical protein DPMN_089644 [Dreissena polymorpha]|uniref:Uncharacterized protein n=1 Tax=Dreissena polymorpha TaxID=45954 RepID=A0A9D4KXD6_DREPO|nr:hypothetical protein DPMN_089644 [Dreissena polymorpha]